MPPLRAMTSGAPVAAARDHTAGHGVGSRLLASVPGERESAARELPTPVDQRFGGAGDIRLGDIRPGGGRPGRDRPERWLTASMLALAVLAAGSATVSYTAQFRMVLAAKGSVPAAALEAAIPDVAALIFATLGIALALHGKRAIRARVLNVAAVATSVAMNALAAAPGWRAAAIWIMPPVAYALGSDTAIGVVRAWTIARQKALRVALADDEAPPLAILGGLLLWLLRLSIAPSSTLAGFRAWVVQECPVAPGRRALPAPSEIHPVTAPPSAKAINRSSPTAITKPSAGEPRQPGPVRDGTKTARFLALVADRYGPLSAFPLAEVSRVSSELAPEVGLNPGAARSALRRHILSLQDGSPQ